MTRKCDRTFSASNLYIAFPSVIKSASGIYCTKTIESFTVDAVEQIVDFVQEAEVLFVTKEKDCYVEINDGINVYDISEKEDTGFMNGDTENKYIGVFPGDIVSVSDVDFVSKLGHMTLKDRFNYLKHPLNGSMELKKTYSEMQKRLKEEYSTEDLEEILFYINHLKRDVKEIEKIYLVHNKKQDYFIGNKPQKVLTK